MVAKLDGTNGLLQQYDYQAPTTGFSYTFAAGVNVLVMNPAGTLATGTITMPASPADGMTISFSSTQTITALTVNANTGQSIVRKPTSFGAGSGMTFVYRLSNTTWYPMTNYATAGTVLQVVSTAKTDTFTSTTTGAFTDITGMSVSITPTSSTSKILVNVTGGCMGQVATSGFMLQLLRDSTAISVGDTAGSRIRASMNGYSSDAGQLVPFSIQYLDSPATTSATTYKIQFRISAGTFYFNRTQTDTDSTNFPRIASSITVMEIAA